MLGVFQLSSAFFCEFVNFISILQSETLADVIKDYIAFGIIAEIDNILGSIMFSVDIQKEIEQANIMKDLRRERMSGYDLIKEKKGEKKENLSRIVFALGVLIYNLI